MKKKIEEYNLSNHGSYRPMPALSPYAVIDKNRLDKPKFIYRKTDEFAKTSAQPKHWVDVGCANGELIYYLSGLGRYQSTQFTGVEITPDFAAVAKELLSSRDVQIIQDDVFSVALDSVAADVVSCLGTFQIFPDPAPILNRLIDLTASGGLLIVDGRFNPNGISIITKYSDDSKLDSAGVWRCDFNTHSEQSIGEIIAKRTDVKDFRFEYHYIDTDIPKQSSAPAINMWTVRDSRSNLRIVNGMGTYFDPSFLIIRKY
jgi:SAM-dependent methyltransferase